MLSAGFLLLLLLANFNVGSYDIPFIGSKWRVRISPAAERLLANNAMQPFKGKILPVNDYRTLRIHRILNRLSDAAGLSKHVVHIVMNDQHSAFIPVVGRVFITTGMLRLCRNDNEVATILAHEVVHGAAKHSSESRGCNALLIALAPLNIMVALVIGTAWNFIQPQRNETEADKMGVLLTTQAHHDPRSLASVFERTLELYRKGKRPQQSGLGLFWSRPPTEKCIKNIQAMVREALEQFPVPAKVEDHSKAEEYLNQITTALRTPWPASMSIPDTWIQAVKFARDRAASYGPDHSERAQ